MTDEQYRACMSAPIELELTHSAPLFDCEICTDAPWPMPTPAPVDPRSRAEKIIDATRRLLFGEKSV
jgi:hypothetical protein